jgi:hypothetical protein
MPQRDHARFNSGVFIDTTAAQVYAMLHEDRSLKKDIDFNQTKETRHLFQFRNGAYNFNTRKLEPRTREMYITVTLKYDFSPNRDTGKEGYLHKIFKQIIPDGVKPNGEPDDEDYINFLIWRGYCMTGYITEEMCMLLIGHGGGNGKGLLASLFALAFPIYYAELQGDVYDVNNYSGFHKGFSSLLNLPVRMVHIAELSKKPMDAQRVNQTIDKDVIKVNPLYVDSTDMPVQFKLEANSNYDPDTSGDNGVSRRGRRMDMTSKFVTDKKDVNEANHVYLVDTHITNVFTGPDATAYKLALFHIYAEYATQYVSEGMKMTEKCRKAFKEGVDAMDEWGEFFADYVEFGVKGKGSFAYKKDIEKLVDNHFDKHDNKKNWKEIKAAFQRQGTVKYMCKKYEYRKELATCADGEDKKMKSVRYLGAFENCKLVDRRFGKVTIKEVDQ